MKWNKIYIRKTTKEEKEQYDSIYIWEGFIPDVNEKILVSLGKNSETFIDTWHFSGLENTDVDEFYWMSLPQFKGENE